MREPGRRDLGRPLVEGQRPRGPPAPGILLRQLGCDGVDVPGVQQLEDLGDPPVQQPASRRADRRVRRFAQQVVGEVVAVAELPHDPAPPELVHCLHDGISVKVARLGEQVEGEVRADRSRQARHLPGRPVACSRRLRSTAARSPADSGTPPASSVPRTASITYSGKPPVVACSKLASAAARGRPEMAWASRAVSAASSGPRDSSVSSPVARIRTVQLASSGSSSTASSRSVAATSSRASSASPRQNVMNASVSWSHHCRLSRTSRVGRPTASSARAMPSKKR